MNATGSVSESNIYGNFAPTLSKNYVNSVWDDSTVAAIDNLPADEVRNNFFDSDLDSVSVRVLSWDQRADDSPPNIILDGENQSILGQGEIY